MAVFNKTNMAKLISCALLSAGLSAPVLAASGQNHFSNHIVGLFAGATSFEGKHGREKEATYGIEYEYRLNANFSLGATYETSPDAHHDDGVDVQLVNAYYRPDAHWRIGVGFGEEKVGGHHPHDESLKRVGVAYDFHFDGFGVAPALNVDFVNGHKAYVVGIALSKTF